MIALEHFKILIEIYSFVADNECIFHSLEAFFILFNASNKTKQKLC